MKTSGKEAAALPPAKAKALAARLAEGWTIARGRLEREFLFPDFRAALAFTDKVGALAEKLGHHPDVTLSWGKVRLILWSHDAGGLTERDFVLAARVDVLERTGA